jgi:hypothetical protein
MLKYRGQAEHVYLIKRWISLARKIGLKAQVYATAETFDLLCFRSPALKHRGCVYLSAGINGDEAAATEELYEMNVQSFIRRYCLNSR